MKRIGLMGCGVVADYGHIPVIQSTEGLELHAVFDPNPERLGFIAHKYGIRNAFTDEEAFFASGIDGISITSPAPVHIENVRSACRHGKHILCEKPLAMSAEECREMIDLADSANVMLFTGFDYRFSPAALKIRSLVQDGAIGKVLSLRLIYIWNCHGKFVQDPQGGMIESPRRKGRMLEGGPLVDCGVHQIDLARFWLGSEAVSWTAEGAWVDEYDAPDHVYLHIDHENGAHSMVEMSFSFCHTCQKPFNIFTYDLIGTDGVIHYDRNTEQFNMRNRQGVFEYPFAPEKNFAAMYELYRDALETGKSELLPTGWDGLMAARISRETTDALIARHLKRK